MNEPTLYAKIYPDPPLSEINLAKPTLAEIMEQPNQIAKAARAHRLTTNNLPVLSLAMASLKAEEFKAVDGDDEE